VVAYTNAFTITVACSPITTYTISTPSDHIVPNSGTTASVVAGSTWHSSTYMLGVCALSYKIIKVSSPNVELTGSWLVINAAGDLTIDFLKLGDETVFIRYT